MHVALFSPEWPLKRYPNGIVTYVHWMREELLRSGHRVSIFTGPHAEAEPGVYPVHRSLLHRARSWLRSRRRPSRYRVFEWGEILSDALNAVHRTNPIDVLEIEESFGWAGDVATRTAIPTVVRLHGPAFLSLVEEELATPFAGAKIEHEGRALRSQAVLTSPSRYTLDSTVAHYGLTPAIGRHIVNPLSLPSSAPLWTLDGCEQTTLLFVGRFDKRKGGDIVLRAFAFLLARNPRLQLVFVGPDAGITDAGGTLRKFADFRADLLPDLDPSRIVFRGRLPPEEIYALRAKAFLTVVASRWENQSYTTLEAMLQGCPIVSTDAGGQGEIIIDGQTGLLARPDDPQDLQAKIQRLLDAPEEAAALGAGARRHALEHHSPARVVSSMLAVYAHAITLAAMLVA